MASQLAHARRQQDSLRGRRRHREVMSIDFRLGYAAGEQQRGLFKRQIHERERERRAKALRGLQHDRAQAPAVECDRLRIRMAVQDQVRADRHAQTRRCQIQIKLPVHVLLPASGAHAAPTRARALSTAEPASAA